MKNLLLVLLTGGALANINLNKLRGKPCASGDVRYAVGCNNQYFHCINGQEHIMSCASGLTFDPVLDRCEYETENTICQSGDYNEAKRIPAVKPSCESEGQLIATAQCNQNYYHCAHGVANIRKCPYNQVFIETQSACDYKSRCKIIRSHRISGALNDSGNNNNETDPFEGKSLVKNEDDLACEAQRVKKIGQESCSTTIHMCANGQLFQQTCPHGLIFNIDKNLCDFSEAVPGCGNYSTITADEFSCDGKDEGFYTLGHCSKNFIVCSSTKRVISCPDGLLYDERISACDYPESCKGTRKPDELPELDQHGLVQNNGTVDGHENFDCTLKPDGLYYEEACKETFFECSDNTTLVRNCPVNLVYNPANLSCDYPGSCDPSAPSTQDAPKKEAESTNVDPKQPGKFSCDGRPDGLYPNAVCSRMYHSCWNNVLSILECPVNLTFNAYKGLCDYPEKTECGEGAQLEQLDPYCERLADGVYGVGCNQFYYKCYKFETFKLNCPEGHYFNVITQACQHASFVAACGGSLPSQVQPQHEPESPSTIEIHIQPGGPEIPASPAPEPPKLSVFSCEGKEDGIYALHYCTPEYVQCVKGKALITRCLYGLFFNKENGVCDYEDQVPQCQLEKEGVNPKSCVGKANGYHNSGCSKHYYFCDNENTVQMSCPSNLKFSKEKELCEYPENVNECSPKLNIDTAPEVFQDALTTKCTLKGYGTFAATACGENYFICGTKNAVAQCPQPLVFDDSINSCNYRSAVPECQK